MENEMTLPCGCVVGVIGDAFTMIACPLGAECEWVQYAIAESQLMDKPYTILDM